jgi:hypothetical protein
MKLLFTLNAAVAVLTVSTSTVQARDARDMSPNDSFLALLGDENVPPTGHHRRLSTLDFDFLVACHTTGRLPVFRGREGLALEDYGCWCGRQGDFLVNGPCKDGNPVDDTDRCCRTHFHDWGARAPAFCDCVDHDYDVTCKRSVIDPARFEATCPPGQDACATYCCNVDLQFANCLIAAAATQNNERK